MNFKPLGERILIKRIEEDKKTASGIIIPDNAKEKPSRGEVVAISEEITTIKNGEHVMFEKYAGTELTINGVEYLVLDKKNILGIIK